MTKLDNYVYQTICETTLGFFKESNYQTYSEFCRGFYNSIQTNNLSKKEITNINKLGKRLELIYAIKADECGYYIVDYFDNKKYLIFEKSTRIIFDVFRNSIN